MRLGSAEHAAEYVDGFRQRGHRHVSRIESFSDAVFGFSITLLVVSLQVPRTFDDLLTTLAGFPAFALSFALLGGIWFAQYRFFRRYALQDSMTIFLNIVLLFVIVFFTYPLKFLFGIATSGLVSARVIANDQWTLLYLIYGLGYAAVFAIFCLLHGHVLRRRAELELTPLEVFDTRRTLAINAFQILIAVASIGTAFFFSRRGDYAEAARYGGLAYILIPLGIRTIKLVSERKRRALILAVAS